ncbi:MAG: aminotransferase [Alphaproteobacteria bacterium]
MTFRTNSLVGAVAFPPIAEAHGWISGRTFPEDKPLIDVAQAVPAYPPASALTAYLARRVRKPETARYTEIAGIPPLRAALARQVGETYGGEVRPDQVCITAGCNQAFVVAIVALAEAGDDVILALPYYFNHRMTLDMLGIRVALLPFQPERGGVPDPETARALITARTKAIVLVTPNNPTGAIYPPDVLAAFDELAREHGVALILDEVYKDFLPDGRAPHRLFRRRDWPGTLIHLYSFSKVYSLSGYRVGAMVADAAFVAEVAKVMDCVQICAPRIGQDAALFGLDNLDAWQRGKRETIARRAASLRAAFRAPGLAYDAVSMGAHFAYVRHPFAGVPAIDVARRLAHEENLLCLPGSMFGPDQEDYLRFAFANLDDRSMPEIARRLLTSQDWRNVSRSRKDLRAGLGAGVGT